jgi:hypothetical protein
MNFKIAIKTDVIDLWIYDNKKLYKRSVSKIEGISPEDTIANDLWSENCDLSESFNHEIFCNLLIAICKNEQHLLKSMINVNMFLKNTLKLDKPIFWEKIIIIASWMNIIEKTELKEKIKYIKNIEDIKTFLKRKNVNIKIDNNTLIISLTNMVDCVVCFKEFKKRPVTFCKVCKSLEICQKCESDIMNKFKKCAFCKTKY